MSNGKVIHLKKKECNIFFTKNIYKVYQKKLKKREKLCASLKYEICNIFKYLFR